MSAAEVTVLLTDDEAIQALNRDFRSQDKPTDVLSFAQRDLPRGPFLPSLPGSEGILGDVIISVETAERQARQFDAPLEHELALLTVHGILHLLGYDDATDEGAEEMRVKERSVLAAAGIPHHRDELAEQSANPGPRSSVRGPSQEPPTTEEP